ncbi:MAG: ATP-dependent protease, partial [Candidatus Pacebacteria bacterium]|nr:ATP-dependent protease [Candidatus Paceibacterota bacterium]
MAVARTYTASMIGLKPIQIEVEVDANRGTPNLIIIGLPAKAVDEAKERITATLLNCGIRIRSKRTIVNLAPADIRKTSSSLDLAIIIAILKMYQEVELDTTKTMFFGELALDGQLKPIKGLLPLVLAARDLGFKQVVFPAANSSEVKIISDIKLHPIKHLKDYLAYAWEQQPLPVLKSQGFQPQPAKDFLVDFANVHGQEQAKRA